MLSFHSLPGRSGKSIQITGRGCRAGEDPDWKLLGIKSKALLDDDYLANDLAWMDMQNNTLDFVVGPIKTYEDQLYGYKASHSDKSSWKDKEWSKRLSEYAQYCPNYRKIYRFLPNTKGKANITQTWTLLRDLLRRRLQCRKRKNIAINLLNDPRVHAAKGSRKLQLKTPCRPNSRKWLCRFPNC